MRPGPNSIMMKNRCRICRGVPNCEHIANGKGKVANEQPFAEKRYRLPRFHL